MSIDLASEEVILDQETIWRETLANDSVTENEACSGRQLPAEVDQQMLHDISYIEQAGCKVKTFDLKSHHQSCGGLDEHQVQV